MLLNPFTYHAPQSLEETAEKYASLPEARLLAGGTFLINTLKTLKKRGLQNPQHIISLRKVAELKGIKRQKERLLLGAMTTFSDILDSELCTGHFEILKTVSRGIGTTPIRNMGTIGGNLASRYPWTEMAALMIALDAELTFVDAALKEEKIPAEAFFTSQAQGHKILSVITLPDEPDTKVSYFRARKSADLDLPLIAVGIKTRFAKDQFSNTRVVINGGTRFATRDKVLEKFLNSSPKNDKIITEAMQHLDPNLFAGITGEYKRHLCQVGIRQTLTELVEAKT